MEPLQKLSVEPKREPKPIVINPILKEAGVIDHPVYSFIMNFYKGQMEAGHLMSDIDKQNFLDYIDMMVYNASQDYVKQLNALDDSKY